MLNRNNQSVFQRASILKKVAPLMFVASVAFGSHTALAADGDPAVKKSNSGICHDASSRHFSRVKNFEPYASMQACLDDGGRAPKK